MAKLDGQKLQPTVKPVRRGEQEERAALPQKAQAAASGGGRMQSGIPGLDELIGGGFEPTSTTLVMGDAGCGKTTFLSQFIHNGAAQFGEAGVLLTFEEPAESISSHMQRFGFDFAALEADNMFASINYRPHEVKKLIDEGGGLILDTVSSMGAKRLAIDSLTSYAMLFESPYQAREAEISLFELLRKWRCTALLSSEGLVARRTKQLGGIDHLADGVILLHHPRRQSVRYRAIEVLKMRGVKQSERLCPFEFLDGTGIKVYPGEEIFYDLKETEE